ncbi:MAG: hypothetical protein HXY24_10770 [Rubrivivax sp.]|nr:hypothetical protein [Rubrivivax sp.]
MKLLDDDVLEEVADGTDTSNGSGVEDKDFLKSLEKKAEEVEDEPDSIE